MAQNSLPVIETSSGNIRGRRDQGLNIFKGVRYGADTRQTRFARPKPPQAWAGVVDARQQVPETMEGIRHQIFPKPGRGPAQTPLQGLEPETQGREGRDHQRAPHPRTEPPERRPPKRRPLAPGRQPPAQGERE
ncbi:MAG: hypothetical protein RL186_1785, partial [Pseudomonadota bacterium]